MDAVEMVEGERVFLPPFIPLICQPFVNCSFAYPDLIANQQGRYGSPAWRRIERISVSFMLSFPVVPG